MSITRFVIEISTAIARCNYHGTTTDFYNSVTSMWHNEFESQSAGCEVLNVLLKAICSYYNYTSLLSTQAMLVESRKTPSVVSVKAQ